MGWWTALPLVPTVPQPLGFGDAKLSCNVHCSMQSAMVCVMRMLGRQRIGLRLLGYKRLEVVRNFASWLPPSDQLMLGTAVMGSHD